MRRLFFALSGPRPNRIPTLSREERRTARALVAALAAIVAALFFMLYTLGL